jgi:hypothetical protein
VEITIINFFQSDNYLKGYIGKDLIKSLLESAGYTVCHYGYEDTLLDFLSKRTSKTSNSRTGRRIRKSPDLLVYDDQDIMLTEVKTRLSLPPEIGMSVFPGVPNEIDILKEFWNDAIMVLIVPDKNVFYAQRISEIKNPIGLYLSLEGFKKLEDIFTKVKVEHISHYREITFSILQLFMSKTQKEKFDRAKVSL